MFRPKTHTKYINMVLLYCAGERVDEIASRYGMSRRSVEFAFDRMRSYYGAVNVPHLIAILFRLGVIE